MKGRVVAIVVILACIGGRLLIDMLNKPEEKAKVAIVSTQVGNLLERASTITVSREIMDVTKKDSVVSTANLTMAVTKHGESFKVKTSSNQANAFSSLFDASNYILTPSNTGFDIANLDMVKRGISYQQDQYEFDNYGNPLVKQIDAYNDLLDSAQTSNDWLFLDMKLRPFLAFNNRMFKKDESGGASGSNSFLGKVAQQTTNFTESADSTHVMITSSYMLDGKEVSIDSLSYNMKSKQFNFIKSYTKLNDQYTLKQTISQ